jgi:hypothetical protein
MLNKANIYVTFAALKAKAHQWLDEGLKYPNLYMSITAQICLGKLLHNAAICSSTVLCFSLF